MFPIFGGHIWGTFNTFWINGVQESYYDTLGLFPTATTNADFRPFFQLEGTATVSVTANLMFGSMVIGNMTLARKLNVVEPDSRGEGVYGTATHYPFGLFHWEFTSGAPVENANEQLPGATISFRCYLQADQGVFAQYGSGRQLAYQETTYFARTYLNGIPTISWMSDPDSLDASWPYDPTDIVDDPMTDGTDAVQIANPVIVDTPKVRAPMDNIETNCLFFAYGCFLPPPHPEVGQVMWVPVQRVPWQWRVDMVVIGNSWVGTEETWGAAVGGAPPAGVLSWDSRYML